MWLELNSRIVDYFEYHINEIYFLEYGLKKKMLYIETPFAEANIFLNLEIIKIKEKSCISKIKNFF